MGRGERQGDGRRWDGERLQPKKNLYYLLGRYDKRSHSEILKFLGKCGAEKVCAGAQETPPSLFFRAHAHGGAGAWGGGAAAGQGRGGKAEGTGKGRGRDGEGTGKGGGTVSEGMLRGAGRAH